MTSRVQRRLESFKNKLEITNKIIANTKPGDPNLPTYKRKKEEWEKLIKIKTLELALEELLPEHRKSKPRGIDLSPPTATIGKS